MIKHILKDGSSVSSVAGIVIKADRFDALYRMMGGISVYRCVKCYEKFLGEELSEWRNEKEEFSMHPFICPDCYDRLRRMNLEDQFKELLGGEE